MAQDINNDVTDDLSDQFVEEGFEVASFLNEKLPLLNLSSQNTAKQPRATQLHSTATGTTNLSAQLGAFSARASTELTLITDEILRSANRLAYEVEVLRSDANGFCDLLSEELQADIGVFVRNEAVVKGLDEGVEMNRSTHEPEFMVKLRELNVLKSRLEAVISAFGEALKWPVAPSDVSNTSTLISNPELGIATVSTSTAEDNKARAVTEQFRNEIVDLLSTEGGGYAGVRAGLARVEQWRSLALLWKGTVEEKARTRVVDGFEKLVDDRKKQLDMQAARSAPGLQRSASGIPSRTGTPLPSIPGASGLLGGLRKLRDEIYLD